MGNLSAHTILDMACWVHTCSLPRICPVWALQHIVHVHTFIYTVHMYMHVVICTSHLQFAVCCLPGMCQAPLLVQYSGLAVSVACHLDHTSLNWTRTFHLWALYYTVDTNILSSGYTYIERSPGRSNVVIETNSHVIKSIHCACAILHVTVFVFTSDMARRLGRLLLPKVYRDSLVRLSVRLSSDQAYVPDKPPVEGEKNAISPPFRYCVMCVLYLCV